MHQPPSSPFKSVGGLKRIGSALLYSLQGLQSAWRHEAAFRQESILVLLLFPFAWWLGKTPLEIISLIGVLLLVLIVELLNSALEALADAISTDFHPLIKRAKDMGSAAVLCSLLFAGSVWLSLFFMRLLS